MTGVTTRDLVCDYISYRLQQNGLEWRECPTLPAAAKIQRTLRVLGAEFEMRYREIFSDMCNQLHITPSTAHPTFIGIVNELFSDGIKWGRIVALFSFGGTLAVQCIETEMPPLVSDVVNWVTDYIDQHLYSWILEHGGWEGMVNFFDGSTDSKDESPWPPLRTICSYAIGAVGVLTLGAILAQRS